MLKVSTCCSFVLHALYTLAGPGQRSGEKPCSCSIKDNAAIGTDDEHAALDAGICLTMSETKQTNRLPKLELVMVVHAVPCVDVSQTRTRWIRGLVHAAQVFYGVAAILQLDEHDAAPLP